MKALKLLAALMLMVPSFLAAQEDNTAGCVISDKRTHVKVAGSRLVITDSVEMTVLDRRGESFTTFAFQYSKRDNVSVNYAYISDMRGNIVRKLKNSDIRETQYTFDAGTLYNDEFTKYFDLRHNSYPYRISYSVTYTFHRFMSIGYLSPEGRCNIENGTYTIEVPSGYPLKRMSRNLAEPELKSGKTDRYIWKYKYDYRKPEVNQSPVSDTDPYLVVLPEKFSYGVDGSYDSWESLGKWAWDLNSGLDKLPGDEKARIDRLLEGVSDDREKVRILYHYLQDYNRYINVKIDLGGLKSYPAEYVCRNRFGDCKALCNYMRAILRYAGIESYYTLAYLDGQVPYFNEDFPNDAFNHIIVTVPLDGETLFLECTSKNSPFNYPGTSNQGRKALATKQSGSCLVDVPPMTPEDTECIYRFHVKCPDERTSAISLDAKLRGGEFEHFVFLATGANKNDVEIYLRNYAFGKTMQMTGYGIERPHRDSAFVNLRVDGTNTGFYRIFGQTMMLENVSLEIPAYEAPGNRKSQVQIDFPRNDTSTVEYELTGIRLSSIPKNVSIESPYGSYSAVFGIADGRLKVTKNLRINTGNITLDEYPGFYDFISRVRSHEYSKYQIPMP